MYLDVRWDPRRLDEVVRVFKKSPSEHLTSPSGPNEVQRGSMKSDEDFDRSDDDLEV